MLKFKQLFINQAKEEAARKIKDSELVINKQKKEAYDEIHNAIVNVALDASEKILGREFNEKDNEKIVNNFIKDINNKNNGDK